VCEREADRGGWWSLNVTARRVLSLVLQAEARVLELLKVPVTEESRRALRNGDMDHQTVRVPNREKPSPMPFRGWSVARPQESRPDPFVVPMRF
jgi:hypothetical protein